MSIDATALPSELLVAPQPLIGFCGLDASRNVTHKAIWDAFSANRKADRALVHFKLLPANYEFPVSKPKRASYEWYHPKGILKRNWMLKHLHVLPSVVVLFIDLEWNDPQWSEKQLQCAAQLQALKNHLHERNTRLCLVLLQKAAPLPPGEDPLSAERAASLTSACGINNKMLFILPHTEHLMGYALRLESAFLDMAQNYYTLMAKRVRGHRDQLTAAHTTLNIRYHFKLGFVAELRQDYSTALKHYSQAYCTLDEIRITDTNCLEIKTIAGFLNYKICRLMFKLKVPRDAINHFVSHVERYKNRVGFKDLLYEHYAWLSSQHSVFAELFCDAIKNGLPALQTQHPGIYFHKAAEYTSKRREAFQQSTIVLSPSEAAPPANANSMALYTEFFGIRAVKTGDPQSEQQMYALLRETEKAFNHSAHVIHLLGQAMAQFKIYKCLRFRKKLAVDMAEEYFKSRDHAKALTLYSLMLPDYRQDKWPTIFSDVLVKTLRCALLSASVADYVSCSIEALSTRINYDRSERIIVLENLWKVFQHMAPVTQNQFAPEIIELWEAAFTSLKSPLTIDLDKISEVFELSATFEKVELKNDDVIRVNLILKLVTDLALKMRGFSILLTDGANMYKLPASKFARFGNLLELRRNYAQPITDPLFHGIEQCSKLEPDAYYQIVFTTEAQQFLENTQLRVARIELEMGSDKLTVLMSKTATTTCNAFRHHSRTKDLDDNITINPICYIAPTFHLVTQTNIDNDTSMLVNEYFPVVTTINNPYNVFLQNIVLSISVPKNLRNKVFLTTDVSANRQKLHSQIQLDIGELSMQSSNTVTYYIYSLVDTTVSLQQKVCYAFDVVPPRTPASIMTVTEAQQPSSTDTSPENPAGGTAALGAGGMPLTIVSPVQIDYLDEGRLRKTREDTLSIKCDVEFKFVGRFYTLDKKPLRKIYRGENFLFRANVEVQAKQELDILETYFICDHNLVQSTYSFKRKKFSDVYHQHDKLEDVIMLRTNATLDDWLTPKEFERLKGDPQARFAFNSLQLNNKRNTRKSSNPKTAAANDSTDLKALEAVSGDQAGPNKSLYGKIPTNMTIINNGSTGSGGNSMYSSVTSAGDDLSSKLLSALNLSGPGELQQQQQQAAAAGDAAKLPNQSRLVYNKAIEAVQATGHCRGFIKGVLLPGAEPLQARTQAEPYFGVYCIKWRRHGCAEENESKFIVSGMEIESPPLNIFCTIEEKMFVKMPMAFRVVLKNPTTHPIHLVATLTISNADNFICSGHKQLDISIFAQDEQEIVYNLYPLNVGWQSLPELSLEYCDHNKDDAQNQLLSELVERSLPKKVFVLPPLKQQIKAAQ